MTLAQNRFFGIRIIDDFYQCIQILIKIKQYSLSLCTSTASSECWILSTPNWDSFFFFALYVNSCLMIIHRCCYIFFNRMQLKFMQKRRKIYIKFWIANVFFSCKTIKYYMSCSRVIVIFTFIFKFIHGYTYYRNFQLSHNILNYY